MTQQQPDIAATLLQWLRDVVYVLIGGILGFVSSWVVSKRERKWARADQRRERIYGPLEDELTNLSLALPRNEDVLSKCAEYPRIKLERLRYMIPQQLREKLIELYEQVIPKYTEEKSGLANKYRNMIGTELTRDLRPPSGYDPNIIITATSRPYVARLASLAYWLLEGQIPRAVEQNISADIRDVKEDSRNFQYGTWQEFFESWRKRQQDDIDFKNFVETRDRATTLVLEIITEISRDLESEN